MNVSVPPGQNSALGALLTSVKAPVSPPPVPMMPPVMPQQPDPQQDLLIGLGDPSLPRPVMPVAPQTPGEKPCPPSGRFQLGDEMSDGSPKAQQVSKPPPPGATVCESDFGCFFSKSQSLFIIPFLSICSDFPF